MPTEAKEFVKKHVAAIHTSGELTLLERKMTNVLLLNAYDELVSRRTHKIPVKHLCAMLGWDDGKNVDRLKDALRRLASTVVEFNVMEDGKEVWQVMSMISFGEIRGGVCTYRYDDFLAERLYDPEVYATINIGTQRLFEGGHALTLYENCLRYRAVGSTGWWDLAKFRRIVGAENAYYDDFRRLNAKVIKPSVDEINRVAEIRIEAEFQRTGRKVSALRFLIEESPQQSLLKPEALDQHAAIRETDIYAKLREHGIGERLAIFWILQDEPRARAVVDYVEAKDRKKQVKGSTAGYIRTLFESEAEVGKPAYEEKKAAVAKDAAAEAGREQVAAERRELENEYQKKKISAAIDALGADGLREQVRAYAAEKGEEKTASYSEESGEFRDVRDKLGFMVWLRAKLSVPVDPQAFDAWLAKKKERRNATAGG